MAIDPDRIENVRLADEPRAFARHIDEVSAAMARAEATRQAGSSAAARRHTCRSSKSMGELRTHQLTASRAGSGSRKVFAELFSFPRYVERLDGIAAALLNGNAMPSPRELAPAPTPAGASLNGSHGGVALH
jgi:hypothetical protein